MLRPSAYPWSDAGNPARNIGAKGRIRGPECPLQCRFLIQHNVKVGCEPEQRAVCDETPIAKQKSLTGNGNKDRDVHRISNVTVESPEEFASWIAAQQAPACPIPHARNAQMNPRSRECQRG